MVLSGAENILTDSKPMDKDNEKQKFVHVSDKKIDGAKNMYM